MSIKPLASQVHYVSSRHTYCNNAWLKDSCSANGIIHGLGCVLKGVESKVLVVVEDLFACRCS